MQNTFSALRCLKPSKSKENIFVTASRFASVSVLSQENGVYIQCLAKMLPRLNFPHFTILQQIGI